MSIKNFEDGSIPISSSQNSATSIVNLTGAFNADITLQFSKAGNMATIMIPPAYGTAINSTGITSGLITFPAGFVPAPIPSQTNPIWGIGNLSINNDSTQRTGFVQIQNNILQLGGFGNSGTIGQYQTISLPYICS